MSTAHCPAREKIGKIPDKQKTDTGFADGKNYDSQDLEQFATVTSTDSHKNST